MSRSTLDKVGSFFRNMFGYEPAEFGRWSQELAAAIDAAAPAPDDAAFLAAVPLTSIREYPLKGYVEYLASENDVDVSFPDVLADVEDNRRRATAGLPPRLPRFIGTELEAVATVAYEAIDSALGLPGPAVDFLFRAAEAAFDKGKANAVTTALAHRRAAIMCGLNWVSSHKRELQELEAAREKAAPIVAVEAAARRRDDAFRGRMSMEERVAEAMASAMPQLVAQLLGQIGATKAPIVTQQ